MRGAFATILALTLAPACATGPAAEVPRPSAAAPPASARTTGPSVAPTAPPSLTTPAPTVAATPAPTRTLVPTAAPQSVASATPTLTVPAATTQPTAATTQPTAAPTPAPAAVVVWESDDQGRWAPRGTPPPCPAQPMLVLPTALTRATSVLYPGQYRPEYKPHGGLRFDGSPNQVEVRAPVDMYVVDGARYPAGAHPGVSDPNELQYLFDFQMPCGVMIRIDHLRKLAPRFQAIAETFPLPAVEDSRTTRVPPSLVRKGELIGTEVGITGNVFYDLGVYDLRAPNAASRDPAYAARRSAEAGPRWLEQSGHAVCWLRDWVPANEAQALAALPGSGTSGKTSDYCR